MATMQILTQRDRLASSSARTALLILRGRAFIVLVLLVLTFSALTPLFFTGNNFAILSKHVALSAILAIGMTFAILTGGIDLSVGSVAGLSGIAAGYVIANDHGGTIPAILAAIAVAVVVGLLNGFLIVRAGVAPFIATLGTLYMARGVALLSSSGRTFPNLASKSEAFAIVGQGSLLHVPVPVCIMLLLYAIATFIASRTPLGRHIYAVGGNERAARLAGIQHSEQR
jgi:erythritol transport system permease protein